MASRKTFHVSVGDEQDLTVEEIWPDGNAPENPTTEDVLARVRTWRSGRMFMRDWNFDCYVEVDGQDAGIR